MTKTREKRFVRFLIFLMVLCRFSFLLVVYLLASLDRDITYPFLDVANTFSTDPARAVAAFLLPITGMLIGVVVALRMRRICAIVHTVPQWLVLFALLFGLFCSVFGLFGIAAVPMDINGPLFFVFAAFWYIGSVLQTSLSTLLNAMVELVQPRWLQLLRIGLTLLLLCAALLLAISFSWLYLVESVASMAMTVITVLYFATYAHASEFPHRSRCPFASLPDIPPSNFV